MPHPQESTPIFDLQGVRHVYTGPQPIHALRGVDLQIYPGEYIALIGANGSGKSTLARHLNALLLPTQGNVWVAGFPTSDPAVRAEIRQVVQMVFQQPDSQIVATTVEEDVAFGPENFGLPEAELPARVKAALETVGMWAQRSRPPHLLSAGQKQRVAIAGALAVQPRALVLDEATAMLDPAGRAAVLAVLDALHAQGVTLITITHEMEEAALAGRVIVLRQGQIVMDGSPHAVFARAGELRNLGLDVPPLADLALRLGLPPCLTVQELLAALGRPVRLPAGGGAGGELDLGPVAVADPLITVRELRYTYLRGTPLATDALRGIDLQVARGAITGLIGPTGSGKSTLLQHINGLIRPQAGHVIVDGQDWADPNLDVHAARCKVGLLFQQPEDQLFERYVGDDVAFGPRQFKLGHAEVRSRVQAAMEAVGLPFEAFKDRLTQTLSGGERRRAALAGVLALQPRVLAADEATAGLDPRGRSEAQAIFRRINASGVTVIFGSHRLEEVAALCERVIALDAGRVSIAGPARAVLSRLKTSPDQDRPALPVAALAAELRAAGWPVPDGTITSGEILTALQAPGVQAGIV